MAQSAVAPDTRYDTDTDFIPDADYNSKILQPDFDSKILQTDDAAKDFKIAAAAPDADSEPDADPDADVSYDFDSPTPLVAGIDPTTSIDPLRDKKRKQRKRINFLYSGFAFLRVPNLGPGSDILNFDQVRVLGF